MLLIAAFDVQVIPIAAMDPSRNLFERIIFLDSFNSPYKGIRDIQIVEATTLEYRYREIPNNNAPQIR